MNPSSVKRGTTRNKVPKSRKNRQRVKTTQNRVATLGKHASAASIPGWKCRSRGFHFPYFPAQLFTPLLINASYHRRGQRSWQSKFESLAWHARVLARTRATNPLHGEHGEQAETRTRVSLSLSLFLFAGRTSSLSN